MRTPVRTATAISCVALGIALAAATGGSAQVQIPTLPTAVPVTVHAKTMGHVIIR